LTLTLPLLFAGCLAAPPTPIEAPVEPRLNANAATAREPRSLVWTTDAAGGRRTWTVDGAGSVIGRADDVRVVAAGRLWAWREEPEAIETTSCGHDAEEGSDASAESRLPPGRGLRATIATADGAGAGQVVEVVVPATGDGAQEIEQRVDLVATVGPYLFVRESTYAYTCGAHGNVVASFTIWNAERQAAVDVDIVDLPIVSEAQARAATALSVDEDVKGFAEKDEPEIALTEVLPHFSHDAELTVDLQFTAPTCYACSDGAWSSYSKSTTRTARGVPAALRAWATPTPGVRAFARAHPELVIGGWSELPAEHVSTRGS